MGRTFKIVTLLGILVSGCLLIANSSRRQPRVVFCNVGQGDAVYIRLPEQKDVLIDTGPSAKVLNCLNREMPYFDREIELLFITHVEKDHTGGLENVLASFMVGRIFLPRGQSIEGKAPFETLMQGDLLKIGTSEFHILWPPPDIVLPEKDLNNQALGLVAVVSSERILLLSDLDAIYAERALEKSNFTTAIFKVCHHGSKYGISQRLLDLADPRVGVISAGRDNWYGHPHRETIELLQSHGVRIKRTDVDGDVRIPL